ncbi:phosphoglycerate kinase [Brevirhabdus pacifica]|uniref:Phosphoglycerate kinase n=1 Tax=Brevirhabdus pacifica TaxID=1267768 RepID=A0A1U7DEJ1_9RHOB|nr:phosphoglycerate kinase [Brevirhabdus pacifica]APX88392.1 phosphoglycerate kinase [Brevirhabdus pacifica]OWU79707.1 phosphoglycerate kinase [Loktanella sp. 22II-4b]PJJ87151.1 phosphoglycerate kinase [Brevirhabdus pacifica]
MGWKRLEEMDLRGKRVLTRVDINVPVSDGRVSDATRIERIVPTVNAILEAGGTPILLAHFGRPKGRPDPALSLGVVLPALERALGRGVFFVEAPIGDGAREEIASIRAKDGADAPVILLENVRFYPGETANEDGFCDALAALGDVYCNDAFSAAHRAHASTEGLARRLPACAGRLMEAELSALEAALGKPARPVAAVVGGAKVSTKLDLLSNLVTRVDHLIIGGGMANTFLHAQGVAIGTSLAEKDLADTARRILDEAERAGCTIHLPVDLVVAREFRAEAPHEIVARDECPPDAMILDAGPESVRAIVELLGRCKTLVWNGPLGAFEIPPFDTATNGAAREAAVLTAAGQLVSVAGGGDTVAALNQAGAADGFSYVSTAGGAFLEWMEGKTLPGVAALGG